MIRLEQKNAFPNEKLDHARLLYIFHEPSTSATTTAYGIHSCLTIAIPPSNKADGMYIPLKYSAESKERAIILDYI